ncbi:3-hydroxybenzoate 6-monooxygenase [Geodermatophilus sp. CPCC 206100]|uniref:3-hydroxybenzoate 6-monooxygenase n=1 Tax=Geodermatophilus sp. CPCC 206100 TaxID=3020054 RepID=UPI003B00160A
MIVVGGGIGGTATALALARRGCTVRLLEQAPEFGEVGAGLQVGPNVMRVLDRLGVMDAVMEIAFLPRSLVLKDALDGSEVTTVDLGDAFRRRFGYPYATIHRADLHAVLVDACRDTGRVLLEPSRRVTGFSQDGTGVEVLCEGQTEPNRADVLIAADGLWSQTRSVIVGDGDPRVTGQVAYRAVLPRAEVDDDLYSESVVLWAGPKLHLAHYPLRRGELFNMGAIFHSLRFDAGANTYGDPDELHERFAVTCDPVRRLVARIEEWRMWVLRDREPVATWTDGRVALLGDAAHPTLQYLAQGAGMAIEDAWVLGELLGQADDAPSWLRAYQDQRSVRTARVTLLSRLYGELYHADGMAREVRRDMLRGWEGPRTHESFAWLYDGI